MVAWKIIDFDERGQTRHDLQKNSCFGSLGAQAYNHINYIKWEVCVHLDQLCSNE